MHGPSISEPEARHRGVFQHVLYRAYPTRRDYSFTYEFRNNSWRAYINNAPDYRGRPAGSSSAHWLPDGGRRYVCWTPEPTTISAAQAISAIWADATENYIRTGRFEPPPGRPQVQDHSILGDRALGMASVGGGSFHNVLPSLRLAASNRAPIAWYEEREYQLWAGGLVVLLLSSLIWIGCMANGFGFWDLFWIVAAGAGGRLAARPASSQPGGRRWIITVGATTAVLGLWELFAPAPGIMWAAFWALTVGCLAQFGRAAARF